jgi:hypothetical protein
MKFKHQKRMITAWIFLLLAAFAMGQSNTMTVPRLVRFSGIAKDETGHAKTGVLGVTFALYKEEESGSPLWLEVQNVQADSNGRYSVLLGSTKPDGIPPDLFTSNEARWLGVQLEGQTEQPRVLFVSVPYALKAADAETLGGKPLSAFQLVAPQGRGGSSTPSATPAAEQPNEIRCSGSAGCKTGFLPEFASNGGSATVSNSIVTQTGAGAAAKIGLGTASPGARFDVLGSDRSAPAAGAQVSTPTFPQYLLNATSGGSNAKIWRMIGRGTNDFEIQTLNDLYGGEVTAMQINRSGTSINNVDFPNGKVGIGTVNPGAPLDVEGSTSGNSVFIRNSTTAKGAGAVAGFESGLSDRTSYGVQGFSFQGVGTFGIAGFTSQTEQQLVGCCQVGLWGDTGSNTGGAAGLVGTADDAQALVAANNGTTTTANISNFVNQPAVILSVNGVANKQFCNINTNGFLFCSGGHNIVVPVDNSQRQVALHPVESPESWFEDFGSGHLESGVGRIALEPTFAQTVNTGSDYHVFLTPKGDCRGLYVDHETAAGFEVHEFGGGQSNVAFDYRIVALRRGYEKLRLEDETAMVAKMKDNMLKSSAKPGERWTPSVRPKPLTASAIPATQAVVVPAQSAPGSSQH